MAVGKPQISVILPFSDAEHTLERALRSIERQTHRHFECIMVDNCAGEGSVGIARGKAARDARFVLVSESQRGVAHAFAAGFEHSCGSMIARMDSDDVMHPRRLEFQQAFLENYSDYGAVAGKVRYGGYYRKNTGLKQYIEWNNGVDTYPKILLQRFVDAPIVNPSAMWRREVGAGLGHYLAGDFPEDYEMWLRWLHHGVRISKIPEVVLDWHDSGRRLTRTHPAYSDEAFYRVKTRYLARWLADNNPHHPGVAVWGASRIYRNRARLLEDYGINITHYIDIHRRRRLDKPLVFYRDLPRPGQLFVLVYVRQWQAKARIRQFLESRGYIEGLHYLMVA